MNWKDNGPPVVLWGVLALSGLLASDGCEVDKITDLEGLWLVEHRNGHGLLSYQWYVKKVQTQRT